MPVTVSGIQADLSCPYLKLPGGVGLATFINSGLTVSRSRPLGVNIIETFLLFILPHHRLGFKLLPSLYTPQPRSTSVCATIDVFIQARQLIQSPLTSSSSRLLTSAIFSTIFSTLSSTISRLRCGLFLPGF